MKVYQAYKDSSITWLGRVPEHWVLNKAKYIFNKMERPPREEDGVVTAFRDGMVTLRTNRRTEGFTLALKEIGYQGIRKGDLVIHEMDAFAGAIGVSDSDGKSTPVYTVCTPRKDADTKYYAYLLKMMAYNGFIQSLAKGIRERSSSFSFNIFQDLELPYFPLPEQQAIADFLDHKTAQIDTLIEKKQRQINLLQEQRTALINHAVTKGLNPDIRMKDSGVEWLGKIPSHWKNVRLKFLTREIIDTEHKTAPFYDGGEYFVVRTSNIKNGKLIFENAKYTNSEGYEEWTRRGVPDPGDVIFTREAPAGEACIVPDNLPIVIGQRTVLIRLKRELFDAEFCIWSIYGGETSEFIKLLSQGSTVVHFNMSDIRDMPFLVPPLEEQKSISSFITSATKRIDFGIDEIISQINNLKEYRTALISEAVTGKIDVRTAV